MKSFIKIIFALLFLFGFLSQSTAQGTNNLTFGTDSTLEIVTWNIEWFPKNGNNTADSVAKIIKALDADVIGFQEIDDTTLLKQVVNNLPGYKIHIAKGRFGGLVYINKTNSVFAKKVYKTYDSPTYYNALPRAPLVMELLYKGEEYVVINNHYKCCGDGSLDLSNSSDEEARRYEASTLIKAYIDSNFATSKVLVIGDLNDILTDSYQHNVFRMFFEDAENYKFADEAVAKSPSTEWSYPSWPSHLDHILITNEIFDDFELPKSTCQTIKVDEYMKGGFSSYDQYVSDHRPVGIKLASPKTSTGKVEITQPKIEVYPNPTNELIWIKNLPANSNITLFDLMGKNLDFDSAKANGNVSISINGNSGIYFLKINSASSNQIIKVFKL